MRTGPKGADIASFGLAGLFFLMASTTVGYQDLSVLMMQEPASAARPRDYAIASPFGTIHAATLNLPQPIGTGISEIPKIRLASIDPAEDIVGSIGGTPVGRGAMFSPPVVNRAAKGDRLIVPQPAPANVSDDAPEAEPQVQAEAPEQIARAEFPEVQADILAAIARDGRTAAARPAAARATAATGAVAFPEYDIAMSYEMNPRIDSELAVDISKADPAELYPPAAPSLDGLNAEMKTERILFGAGLLGHGLGSIEPWAVGEEPILLMPRVPSDPKTVDVKPAEPVAVPGEPAALPTPDAGLTVATKGEAAPDPQKLQPSPAERLNLTGAKREKAVKCLANAIYFESGLEPVRGQIAVAQVIVNRAFSGYYPADVCGVVFQNAHRYMTCQFTFACNGKPLIASSQPMWQRAVRIAEDTLDGKLWLSEIGRATHYHADYVNPGWYRTMNRYAKIGAHIFFRPRMWGDGADKPAWGSAAYTAEAAERL